MSFSGVVIDGISYFISNLLYEFIKSFILVNATSCISFRLPHLQDECYQVRQIFAQKLHLALVKLLLPLEYLAVFALCAKDPVKERRAHARQCLLKNISVRREYIKQNPLAQGQYPMRAGTNLIILAKCMDYVLFFLKSVECHVKVNFIGASDCL